MAIVVTDYITDDARLLFATEAERFFKDIRNALTTLQKYRNSIESEAAGEDTVNSLLAARYTDVEAMKADLVSLLGLMTFDPIRRIVPGCPPSHQYTILAPGDASALAYDKSFVIPSPLMTPLDRRVFAELFTYLDDDEYIIKLTDAANAQNNEFTASVIEEGPNLLSSDNSAWWRGALNQGSTSDWDSSFEHQTGNTVALVQAASRMSYPMLAGYYYTVQWTISGRAAGTLTLMVGTDELTGTTSAQTTNATFNTTVFVPLGANPYIAFVPTSSFDGTLTVTALRPLDWLYLDGRLPVANSQDKTVKVNITSHQTGT